jgi:hypothetical protein
MKLSSSLYTGTWGFWISVYDLNWLKLVTVFLRKLTVTNSEQQKLDKELWCCLLYWCERILNGNETTRVSDYFTMYSVRPTVIFFVMKEAIIFMMSVKLLHLAVRFNKCSRTHGCKFQFCHLVIMKFILIPFLGSFLCSSKKTNFSRSKVICSVVTRS